MIYKKCASHLIEIVSRFFIYAKTLKAGVLVTLTAHLRLGQPYFLCSIATRG